MNPVLATFHRILDELEAEGIDAMVMGGWAVQVWGRPRPTFDVDLTLSLSDAKLRAFLQALDARGFIVDEPFLRGHKDRLSGMTKVQVSLFQAPDLVRIDLFIVASDYQKEAFARRRSVTMFGRQVWVMAPEDLILHKLIAGRHKDIAAVEEIVETQSGPDDLDRDYLRRWAPRLGVASDLDRFL